MSPSLPREILIRSLVGRSEVRARIGARKESLGDARRAVREARRMGDDRMLALALTHHAQIDMLVGDLEGARKHAEKARKLYEAVRDFRGMAMALRYGAEAERLMGHLERAISGFSRAVRISREAGDREEEALSLNLMGLAWLHRGELDRAESCFRKAFRIFHASARLRYEADTQNNLGLVFQARGDMEQARKHFVRAAEVYERLGDRFALLVAQHNIGLVLRALHRHEEALQFHQASRRLAHQMGYLLGVGANLTSEGQILLDMGRLRQARNRFHQAVERFETIGDRMRRGLALLGLGAAMHLTGRSGEALRLFREALAALEEVGHPGGMFQATFRIADILISRKWFRLARVWCQRAEERARVLNSPLAGAAILVLWGRIFAGEGGREDALRFLEQALQTAREAGSLEQVGVALMHRGDLTGSLDDAREALRIFSELGFRARAAQARVLCARLLAACGETQRARSHLREAERYARRAGYRALLQEIQSLRETLRPARRENVSS